LAEAAGLGALTPTPYAAQGCYFQLDFVPWTKPLAMHVVPSSSEDQPLPPTTTSSSAAGEHLVQAQSRASDLIPTNTNPACAHRNCATS